MEFKIGIGGTPKADVGQATRAERRRFIGAAAATGLGLMLPRAAAALVNESQSDGAEFKSRLVDSNGIRISITEAGTGPLVILLHGFPECSYSWRHQIPAIARAGFRVVAPDLRGYGRTDSPKDVAAYTIVELVKDVEGLLDALGEKTCTLVGHDFGAVVAWNAALLKPDRFNATAALSVPYSPRRDVAPMTMLNNLVGNRFFYISYFQDIGVADEEMNKRIDKTLRAFYYTYSYEGESARKRMAPRTRGSGLLDSLVDTGKPPSWLSEAEFGVYVAEFQRNGFTGPLNWYRNLDRNWELMSAYKDAPIQVPALFISGREDPVRFQTKRNFDELSINVPKLTKTVLIPECGHWTQQEKPAQVNAALVEFLNAFAR